MAGLDDYANDDDELDKEAVAEKITEITGEEPIWESDGPRFYREKRSDGEGKRGTLFALVRSGPRLYVDPTAKASVHGIAPVWIRDSDMFEPVTGSWDKSFGYSIMLDDEIPEEATAAVEWSYERFLAVA